MMNGWMDWTLALSIYCMPCNRSNDQSIMGIILIFTLKQSHGVFKEHCVFPPLKLQGGLRGAANVQGNSTSLDPLLPLWTCIC